MKAENAKLVMHYVKIGCPLCLENFRYRTSLMSHLRSNHADVDAERFMDGKHDKDNPW